MATSQAIEPLLTVADVAEICRVSRATVYSWVTTGELKPATLPARKTLFRRNDILRFIGQEER